MGEDGIQGRRKCEVPKETRKEKQEYDNRLDRRQGSAKGRMPEKGSVIKVWLKKKKNRKEQWV